MVSVFLRLGLHHHDSLLYHHHFGQAQRYLEDYQHEYVSDERRAHFFYSYIKYYRVLTLAELVELRVLVRAYVL